MPSKKKKKADDGLHRFAWCWEDDQYHANCVLEYEWNDATVRCECPNHEGGTHGNVQAAGVRVDAGDQRRAEPDSVAVGQGATILNKVARKKGKNE